jgi:hypothetical protein
LNRDYRLLVYLENIKKSTKMEFMDLIEIPRVDNIKLVHQILNEFGNELNNEILEGSLCLTSHHTIFSCKGKEKNHEIWV